MKTIPRIGAVVLLMTLFAIPVAEARTRIYVNIAPPPVVVERHVMVAPHVNYVWRPGYQQWTGRRYVWVPGAWVAAPYRGARWVPGRWRHEHRGYYWQTGQWRR